MIVPSAPESVLRAESPIVGQVTAIEHAASFVDDVSDDCVKYSALLLAASSQLAGARSVTVTSCRDKLDTTLQQGAQKLKGSVNEARRGFLAYAAAVEEIHRRARATHREVGDSLDAIRVAAAVVTDIAAQLRREIPLTWNAPPSMFMPAPILNPMLTAGMDAIDQEAARRAVTVAHEENWRRAVSSWHAAVEEINAASVTWELLGTERKDAERALLALLRNTTLGQLISLGLAQGGSGPKHTVAHSISGELWGEVLPRVPVVKAHPMLRALFVEGDGSQAWDAPPDPEVVAAWWGGLGEAARAQVIREVPWVIGNLPGLPYNVRNLANRESIAFYARYPAELTAEQLKVAAETQEILNREAYERETYGAARPPIQVIALDLDHEVPKAAIGYGDADTAANVTWAVPGMESDAHLAIEDWDTAGWNLYHAQGNIVRDTATQSVVAWLGYDTPALADVLNEDGVLGSKRAQLGAQRLAAELEGNYSAREVGVATQPARHVISHSYGTTTASIALTLVGHEVDTFTMIASAGLDTDIVSTYDDLKVAEIEPGQRAVYTTHASKDYLAPAGAGFAGRGQPNPDAVGAFGLEQRSPVYAGGLSFSSDGDASLGLLATDGHSLIGSQDRRSTFGTASSLGHGYLDVNTQSLQNVAQITSGQVGEEFQQAITVTEGKELR